MNDGLSNVDKFSYLRSLLLGSAKSAVGGFVVPEISHITNEHAEVVKNDYPHLRDLWFSDVCQTKEELEIDLLIGSDYL